MLKNPKHEAPDLKKSDAFLRFKLLVGSKSDNQKCKKSFVTPTKANIQHE
jgi:hypothetical protein